MNLDIAKQILMSDENYFIIAKQTFSREAFKDVRGKDQIIMISIPDDIPRGMKYEDIKLSDIEWLYDSYINENIYLNETYPPFQRGLKLNKVTDVFPLKENSKDVLIKLMQLDSDMLYEYKNALSETNQV